jgi:hypothetical protein
MWNAFWMVRLIAGCIALVIMFANISELVFSREPLTIKQKRGGWAMFFVAMWIFLEIVIYMY